MAVAALVSDLIFATKITSTGAALGVPVNVVRSLDGLDPDVDLVLVDLDVDNAVELITTCKQSKTAPRIVAFGAHVRTDLLEAARAAGADEVMPRSAFTVRLPSILESDEAGSEHARPDVPD